MTIFVTMFVKLKFSIRFLLSYLVSIRKKLYNFLIRQNSPVLFLLANLFHDELPVIIFSWILSFKLRFRFHDRDLIVLWDYSICNYKFGDFVFAITVAKLLSCRGFTVIFAEINQTNSNFKTFSTATVEPAFKYFVLQREEIIKWTRDLFPNILFWNGSREKFNLQYSSRDFLVKPNSFYKRFLMVAYHNLITPLYLTLNESQKSLFKKSKEKLELSFA